MNIVFLDAFTTNRGDLSWEKFNSLGSFTYYDRTKQDKVIERAYNADIIITNKVLITADIMDKLPKLKYICVAATGYNVVDVQAAKKRNIPVSNVAGYSTDSVAQIVFAHIMNLLNRIEYQGIQVREERWCNSPDFTYCDFPIFELSNMTLGVVGFGNIGRLVAKIANSFGMNIIVYKPGEIKNKPEYITVVSKETLFKASDVISLHCPLTDKTNKFINNDTIQTMKRSAYLINTGRGGLIDEAALSNALNEGRIAGAGLDVLSTEPPSHDNPLIKAKNCWITPHIAWTSVEARTKLIDGLVNNIEAFIAGNPINIVN